MDAILKNAVSRNIALKVSLKVNGLYLDSLFPQRRKRKYLYVLQIVD